MSSSTMIHGVTIRRASAYRIPVETTTRPATHAHIGTRRRNASVRARLPAMPSMFWVASTKPGKDAGSPNMQTYWGD